MGFLGVLVAGADDDESLCFYRLLMNPGSEVCFGLDHRPGSLEVIEH